MFFKRGYLYNKKQLSRKENLQMKLYYDKLRNKINRKIEEQHNLELIRRSGLFDKTWYLAKNPDISEVISSDPLRHYLSIGGFQGRDPGPLFCSRWYLNNYSDVVELGINPLVHYIKYGRSKGYKTQSVEMGFINATFCATHEAYISNYYPYLSEKTKVFCIGHNKTGTTSVQAALVEFGYKFGSQWDSEILLGDWVMRDFRRILEFCKTADAFQDVPFSLDYTYQAVDYAFPGSKFILTVRYSSEDWYESTIRFYKKLFGEDGEITPQQIKNYSGGNDLGWLWRFQQYVYGATEDTLFNKELYIASYEKHNAQIIEYFRYRPNDLLIINLSDPTAMQSLCDFLGEKYTGQLMPHLNKSKE